MRIKRIFYVVVSGRKRPSDLLDFPVEISSIDEKDEQYLELTQQLIDELKEIGGQVSEKEAQLAKNGLDLKSRKQIEDALRLHHQKISEKLKFVKINQDEIIAICDEFRALSKRIKSLEDNIVAILDAYKHFRDSLDETILYKNPFNYDKDFICYYSYLASSVKEQN